MNSKNIIRPLITTVVVLLVPFVAMQFTHEVAWGLGDFLIMGALIFGGSLLCELAVMRIKPRWQQVATCVAIAVAVLLVWLQLAVGVL